MALSRLLWLMSAIVAFTLAAAIVYPVQSFVPTILVLAVVLMNIALAPAKLGLLSWSAGIPLFYAVFFLVLHLASRAFGGGTEYDKELAEGLYVAALGLFAFMLGTNSGRFLGQPKSSYDMLGLLRMDVSREPRVVWALVLLGGIAQLWSYFFGYFSLLGTPGREAGPAAGLVSWVGFLLVIVHVMAWNEYLKRKRLLAAALSSTVLMLALGIFSSSKEKMLLPFILIALSFWGISGKFPYKIVFGSLLLYALVIAPFVTFSRIAFVAQELGAARTELAESTVEYLLSGRWMEGTATDSSFVSKFVVGRVDLLPYFSEIVHQSGRSVDFMSGKTIFQSIEILMPRIFFPDKPDANVGNWTAQAFGVVPWYDEATAVAPTYMGEFYMNFGSVGVFLGMLLVGLLATWVDRYVIVERTTWTMPIMVYLIRWQENFFSATVIPFARDAVLWLLVLLLVKHLLQRRNQLELHRTHSASSVP